MYRKSVIAAMVLGLGLFLTATDASAKGGRKGPAAGEDDQAQVEGERHGRKGDGEKAGHGRRKGPAAAEDDQAQVEGERHGRRGDGEKAGHGRRHSDEEGKEGHKGRRGKHRGHGKQG